MVYVNGCCCFQTTKEGSIACGFFTLFSRVVGAILLIIALAHISSVSIYLKGNEEFIYSLRLLFIAQLLDCIIFIIFSILLIHGVRKGNTVMMFPWIVWMIIEIASLGILIVLSLIGVTRGLVLSAVLASVLFSLIFLGIDIYCLLCVTSQYKLFQQDPPPYSVMV